MQVRISLHGIPTRDLNEINRSAGDQPADLLQCFILRETSCFHVVSWVGLDAQAGWSWILFANLGDKSFEELHASFGIASIYVYPSICMQAQELAKQEAMGTV
jgi:hypothetical protein